MSGTFHSLTPTQDITRELPAVLGGGRGGSATPAADNSAQRRTAARPPRPPPSGNGTLRVFDSSDDDEDGGDEGRAEDATAAAAAAAGGGGGGTTGRKRRRPASDDESDDDDDDDDSSAPSDAADANADENDDDDDDEIFISLGAAAERDALLERQAADEARRAAEQARRAAVEGRAFGFRPPWLLPAAPGAPHALPRSRTLRLHNELVAFARMLEPTPAEAAARAASVARVREAVGSVFPQARVLVFGSYATGLYVPTSDIDVVVVGSGAAAAGRDAVARALQALAKQLTLRGLVRPGTLNVIAKARVPIVKFEMAGSGVAFDVSFDVSNGPRAARHVARLLRAWPPLRPLVLALKVFLHQRELNEVYSGGIGSYALIVMAVSALQLHASRRNGGGGGGGGAAGRGGQAGGGGGGGGGSNNNDAAPDCNLGVLLIDFFRLYGRTLNVERVGVTCDEGGLFIDKATAGKAALLAAASADARRGSGNGGRAGGGGSVGGHAVSTNLGVDWRVPERPWLLAVRDPLDPGNDVARNSFNVARVRSAFDFAYQALTAPLALPPPLPGRGAGGAASPPPLPESLLGRVIHLQPVLEGRPLPRWPEAAAAAGASPGGGGQQRRQQARLASGATPGRGGTPSAGGWASSPGSAKKARKKQKERGGSSGGGGGSAAKRARARERDE
jgi:non-canonical poly(A) RNA polymerase PAPD5/7